MNTPYSQSPQNDPWYVPSEVSYDARHHKKKTGKLILGIILGAVLLGGVGAGAYLTTQTQTTDSRSQASVDQTIGVHLRGVESEDSTSMQYEVYVNANPKSSLVSEATFSVLIPTNRVSDEGQVFVQESQEGFAPPEGAMKKMAPEAEPMMYEEPVPAELQDEQSFHWVPVAQAAEPGPALTFEDGAIALSWVPAEGLRIADLQYDEVTRDGRVFIRVQGSAQLDAAQRRSLTSLQQIPILRVNFPNGTSMKPEVESFVVRGELSSLPGTVITLNESTPQEVLEAQPMIYTMQASGEVTESVPQRGAVGRTPAPYERTTTSLDKTVSVLPVQPTPRASGKPAPTVKPAATFTADRCWNQVIAQSSEEYYWPNTCRGVAGPTFAACGEALVALSADEVAQFKAYQVALSMSSKRVELSSFCGTTPPRQLGTPIAVATPKSSARPTPGASGRPAVTPPVFTRPVVTPTPQPRVSPSPRPATKPKQVSEAEWLKFIQSSDARWQQARESLLKTQLASSAKERLRSALPQWRLSVMTTTQLVNRLPVDQKAVVTKEAEQKVSQLLRTEQLKTVQEAFAKDVAAEVTRQLGVVGSITASAAKKQQATEQAGQVIWQRWTESGPAVSGLMKPSR